MRPSVSGVKTMRSSPLASTLGCVTEAASAHPLGHHDEMRIELPESLSDGRVVLRPLRADDAAPYAAAFRDDPELGRLVGNEADPDEATVRGWAARVPDDAAEGKGVVLVVTDPTEQGFQGSTLLHSFDWQHRHCEVGVWLVPAARRQGLGSRVVSLMVSWALTELDLLRVEMTTTPDNEAICALAQRLGFTREGMLRKRNVERGRRIDVVWFGVLREEWRGR
jgi:RimJ/RimL family protein N-acetyltransferase